MHTIVNSISELFRLLNNSTAAFTKVLEDFPDNLFTAKPDENKWSAAGIAEHIIITDVLLERFFRGKLENTENRKPFEKISRIGDDFGDSEKKFAAYGMLNPRDKIASRKEALQKFETSRKNFTATALNQNLTFVVKTFPHPLFGELTLAEWIFLVAVHTERHCKQMENIL